MDNNSPHQRSKFEQKSKKLDNPESDEDDSTPSILKFLGVELTRDYTLEHDEEQYATKRDNVYNFAKIPLETEKFMAFGFFQCADAYLFVYTFLPVRFILAVLALITRPIKSCFGFGKTSKSFLNPAETCDILKVVVIVVCTMMMFCVDTSMLYHMIKSQSVIKLYIFFNMLEVFDRLCSTFGQDLIDAMFWTATEPRNNKQYHIRVLILLFFVIVYVFVHSSLVLSQATTLNVAINSNNKALLTIMISNNFVELKGSVFKKFDKNNLFQVGCSDIRERFHLFILLFIVVMQTMKEYSWKEETLWLLVPDCIIVMACEILVDWVKHAFITRFNYLPLSVYQEYTLSLAYDMAQTRQKNAFTDQSDLVARRMGFIPLPLGVVLLRVLGHTVQIHGAAAVSLAVLAFLTVASFKILNSVILLAISSDLIAHHYQEKNPPTDVSSPVRVIKDSATSPTRPNTPGLQRSLTVDETMTTLSHPPRTTVPESPNMPNLNSTPLFSNSAVSIADVCLNEEMLRVGACLESIGEESFTRSEPNIQQEASELPTSRSSSPTPVKRAESEPSIPLALESEGTNQPD